MSYLYGVECNQHDGVAFFPADEHEEFTDEPLQVMGFLGRNTEMAELNSIFDYGQQ